MVTFIVLFICSNNVGNCEKKIIRLFLQFYVKFVYYSRVVILYSTENGTFCGSASPFLMKTISQSSLQPRF